MHTLQVISENWVSAGQESKTLLFLKWVGGNEVLRWAGGGGRECHKVKRLSNISLHKSSCFFDTTILDVFRFSKKKTKI